MATVTAKRLTLALVSDSLGVIYTPSGATKGVVHLIEIHNINTTAENVLLYDNNGSTNFLMKNLSIDPDDTVFITYPGEGSVYENGDSLKAITDTASKVNIKVNGSEITA